MPHKSHHKLWTKSMISGYSENCHKYLQVSGPSQAGGRGGALFGRSVNQKGHIIPTQYYVPPQIFRPCDGPARIARGIELGTRLFCLSR